MNSRESLIEEMQKTREALIKDLGEVRERGILRIESPNPRLRKLQLPILRSVTPDYARDLTFTRGLEVFIRDAVEQLPEGLAKDTATKIFGLDQDLFNPRPDEWRSEARSLYPYMSADDFRKGPEREVLGLLADEMLIMWNKAGVDRYSKPEPTTLPQKPTPNSAVTTATFPISPEEVMLERSLLHIVRTLEVRQEHAEPTVADTIGGALDEFRQWHLAGKYDAGVVLGRLDDLCLKLMGRSAHELLGPIGLNAKGSDYAPQELSDRVVYHRKDQMAFVSGGYDPFTNTSVKPFYICLPTVTRAEWNAFLMSFGWKGSPTWRTMVDEDHTPNDLDYWALPAVGMSYLDCLVYCFWLWGMSPYRFRLPTESEWNFAATGGQKIRFPWGNEVEHGGGWFSSSTKRPGPLPPYRLLPAGPHELLGQAGNVWEYTSTLWRGEQSIPDSDIVAPDLPLALLHHGWWEVDNRLSCTRDDWLEEVRLVMKGGSWSLGADYATVDARIYSSLFNQGAYGGFRLAASAIRDPKGGHYRPEYSPFLNSHIRRTKLVSADDFYPTVGDLMDLAVAGAVVGGCGGGSGPATDMSSWEELLRSNQTHTHEKGA